MDKAFALNPGQLADVPLSLIDPDPEQPRRDFDDDYISQLADSIKSDGLIQPIVLRTNAQQPGRFLIVAGENRWRASKLAKTKTIPSVLREVDGLSKLIVQLKENHQRKDLNAMEWALALQTMHKVHGLKQTDIEKTLKETGVGQFGRAYISNMIRLLDLPEWAQSLIRNNAITASHGKYLLQAMASEKIIEMLHQTFMDDDEPWNPTTAQLQKKIYYAFMSHHTDLTGYKTDFDYREKCVNTGCQKMRKISSPEGFGGKDSTFCLDQECHAILQADAKREQKAQHQQEQGRDNNGESAVKEITFDDDNRVDINQQELRFHRDFRYIAHADFDTRGCDGCKHRHIALEGDDTDNAEEEDACFLISCYIRKVDEHVRATRLVVQFLKSVAARKINAAPELAIRLLAWVGASEPEVMTGDKGEYIRFNRWTDLDDEEEAEDLLFKIGLTSLGLFLDSSDTQLTELGSYVATILGTGRLIELNKRLRTSIDDYRIDEHYLAEHTAEELAVMLEYPNLGPVTYAEFTAAQLNGNLDAFIKNNADLIGVPKAIRFAYERLIRSDDDE